MYAATMYRDMVFCRAQPWTSLEVLACTTAAHATGMSPSAAGWKPTNVCSWPRPESAQQSPYMLVLEADLQALRRGPPL
nr:hypothetical protein CFP56_07587 [Quercus suber]